VPHLKPLLYTDVHCDLLLLNRAVAKKYLILGGPDNIKYVASIIASTGISVDTWSPFKKEHEDRFITFDELSQYGAVLVYNDANVFIGHTEELGNVLSRYLEEGKGGVVQMIFSLNSNCEDGLPEGSYRKNQYCPIEYKEQARLRQHEGLVKLIPNHFLLVGVDKFNQTNLAECCPVSTLVENVDKDLMTLVATFDDKNKTVAVACRELIGKQKGRVCVLNFHPDNTANPDSDWCDGNHGTQTQMEQN
jgi:hypothetical protein